MMLTSILSLAASLCDVRRWRQQDAMSCRGSGNHRGGVGGGGGGNGRTFGIGKVGRQPPFMVWSGLLIKLVKLTEHCGFLPAGTGMLSMEGDPLQFNSERRFVGGHLEVNHQIPDGILPPRRATIEDIHDSALY